MSPAPHFGYVPPLWGSPTIKHEVKAIVNLYICIGGGGFLLLMLLLKSGRVLMPTHRCKIRPHSQGVVYSLLFSRRDIHRYKVPSKYTKKFLLIALPRVLMC